MTPDEVAAFAATLPRCKRKGTAGRPAWYVDDRLVVRLEDAATLTVRADFDERERLVASAPEVFGVPPRMERHRKVQVSLEHGHDQLVQDAIRAAYEMQRRS